MTKQDIISAYIEIRKTNHNIPDVILDLMKDSAIKTLEDMSINPCNSCANNGNQMLFPSACTGCGADEQLNNFKLN